MFDTAIVVMAKQPVVGKTKTRLCPPFSPTQAARLFEALMLDTIDLARQVSNAEVVVAISPPESESYFRSVTPEGTMLLSVVGSDIGVCLAKSFELLFKKGFQQVIAFNADGPTLPLSYLFETVERLKQNDVVLGPGDDGGYYLIGLKEPNRALFQDIAWSTDQVFNQTKAKINHLNLSLAETPAWYDVDTYPDFQRLVNELDTLPQKALPFTRAYLKQTEIPEK